MPPNQGNDPKDGQLTTRVPSRYKTATVDWAHEKNGEDAYVDVKQATVLRDALYLYFLATWAELPSEIREDLDPQYMADQIVTIEEGHLMRLSSRETTIEVKA